MTPLPLALTPDQVRLLLLALELRMSDADPEQYPAIEDTSNALRASVGLAPIQMYERSEEAA